MSSENRDNCTSSFPIWIPLIYCASLITLSLPIMLNKSGESRYCLVPNLWNKAFDF